MYYTLTLKRKFTFSGRQIKNISGKVVTFINGVAVDVPADIAEAAKRYVYIERVTLQDPPLPELPADEPLPVEPPAAEEDFAEGTSDDAEVTEEESVVEDVSDDTGGGNEEDVPAEDTPEDGEEAEEVPDVFALYDELGTWTAVAAHLGISTAQLKKLRDA